MGIFSPPRVAPVAPQYGMADMGSFDKVNGWDARAPGDLKDLWGRIETEEPEWIIMVPPCERANGPPEYDPGQ
eukprot:4718798-Pyramimonas_sp.AAC.1